MKHKILATLACGAAALSGCDDNLVLPTRALPTTITIETALGDGLANAPFVAVQEGDSPWRALNGLTGRYSFLTAAGRFGTAVVCPSTRPDVAQKVLVQYATWLETEVVQAFCAGPSVTPTLRKLSGTVSGVSAGEAVVLVLGDNSTRQLSAVGNTLTYELTDAPDGVYDIVAAKGSPDPTLGVRPSRFLIRRNVSVTGDTTLDLDFTAGAAPVPFTLTALGALGSETARCSADFLGSYGLLPLGSAAGATLADAPGVPASLTALGEVHYGVCAASTDTTLRTVERYFQGPSSQTLSLPDLFSTPAVAVEATSPYVRLGARFSGVPAGAWVNLEATQEVAGALPRTVWSVALSPGWMQQTPIAGADRTVSLPALGGLQGWSDTYGLQPGRQVKWSVGWEYGTEGNSPGTGASVRSAKRGALTP